MMPLVVRLILQYFNVDGVGDISVVSDDSDGGDDVGDIGVVNNDGGDVGHVGNFVNTQEVQCNFQC